MALHLSLASRVCLVLGCLLSTVDSQAPSTTVAPEPYFLPYVSLGSTDGVQREYVGHFDDGVSHAIHVPGGFPFGDLIHSFVYVGTNGIFSFSEPFYSAAATPFPGSAAGAYIVAPYWDDVDIRLTGNISYEVHSRSGNNPGSNQLLDEVSSYVEVLIGQSFQGSWMLVAEWKEVHPWPHGDSVGNPIWSLFFPELALNNTWQGLVITDGVNSYAVFTYRCGDMNWAYGPTIGFNAAGSSFMNHLNTGSSSGEEIACLNTPYSQWYNLVYKISLPNAVNQTSLPTIEPSQSGYLSFLEFTNSTATSGTLPPCQNCTVAITVPSDGFPFGSHYHSTIYVGTNGIFSFGQDFHLELPEPFPSDSNVIVNYAYLVAPYWSNIDTRLAGQVNYEVHVMGESSTSVDYLGHVSSLINSEEDPDFSGSWMIVATWDSVHPFPHGSSAEQDRVDPYLQSVNTFQGILITNGTQSYSVFTYECDQLEWSDEATIGYNAGGEYNASHPLSGTLLANAVDCLHSNINVTVNNIIFDLVPGELNEGPPPPPPSSLGSCVRAGYSGCCEDGSCLGANPSDCYCDEYCHSLGDCCTDITEILCQIEEPTGNGVYLIFGSLQLLSRVSLTGSDLHVLVHQPDSAMLGVDYDYGRGYLYWSDGIGDALYRSKLNGSNIETLLNTSVDVVDDIAVDWIGNNLYWTDAVYSRIEVMDIDTRHRMELLRTGTNTIPRAIAVDPSTKYMYWTDWGGVAKIERASMDGSDRRVLHSTGLTWPNGLTVDYLAQKIYWVDANQDRIEYSNIDGSGRFILLSGLDHPFSITLKGDLLFWTDWLNDAIHVTHKISGTLGSNLTLYSNLRDRPFGIEAVTPTRQTQYVAKPCDGASCLFMCLLSATDPTGYSCACPDGYELSSDGTNCSFVSTPRPPDAPGSCVAAGYQDCCTAGYCTGSPPNCACDAGCYQRRDCCEDINATCSTGSCAAAGYRACCTDGSSCLGTQGCYCDSICTFFGDCCFDFEVLCPADFGSLIGSCAAAGYTTCCADGSECLGTPANCKCDAECRDHGDCCTDIASTCPLTTPPGINTTIPTFWLPFLTLQVTPGVDTLTVPAVDDGTSSAIPIPTGFPIGNSNQSVAYIGTNGVISFQQPFTHPVPYIFPSELTFISSAFLLAPFWSDVDISIYGSIFYEVHSGANSSLISQVSSFISNHTGNDFTGMWMLVVQWDQVHEYIGIFNLPINTYQAIAITDGSQSYAVYTYRCGHLQWSGGATIGYNGGPVGNFYANHPLSGSSDANSIACVNYDMTEWSNVVYNVSTDVYIPTAPPPTIEPPQDTYLEFLERTNNSLTLRNCDDCVSPAINLGNSPVPFGDLYHAVVHVSSNGIISFGNEFPHFGATLLPNINNPTVYNSYIAAPYWSDIDGRVFGEVWYETHVAGQSTTSNSLLERVSSLVRSERNLSSFQGTWMVVATWNGSVPFAGSGTQRNTFQGIVITNGSKTYAVYTYHCNDVQWSDGSVIGFNAGGSYYANHPLSDSIEARDIDCVHSPESEWNNVVYDVNPNGTITSPPAPTVGWLPFLPLNTTPGVTTLLVPAFDDDSSPPISVPSGFPFGNGRQSLAFIGTNGIISFQQPFVHHLPSLFPSEFTFISSAFLLAPFWSDVDITSRGSIKYEVHSGSDDSLLLYQVSNFVSNYTDSEFAGTWMLVAQWDQVPPFSIVTATVFNTFQAIAITDGSQSYAVYTYRCGYLQWSGGATIGFNGGPVGNLYANHPLSGSSANSIACLNAGVTEWSNVVYNVSCDVCIATQPPPTVEPPQDVYLEFLERTNNSITMRRCDDCSSDAIDLSTSPVPFGDYFHYVAHISTNGLISFGQHFPNFAATLFPNEDDSTVFTAFVAAPYWGDIDNRNLGEIWYETHETGQSTTSNLLLERVSTLVRSEQNLSSFQGTWMVVATWNGSVPFSGSGSLHNTVQGTVITNGSKTYAVYTYHCNDVQWSDGSVIGFNAGGSYYANHPLSNSIEARDIDCVHSPESEWNNVVYDVNPNGTSIYTPPVLSGSCVAAGYTECCNDSNCVGLPVEDCYCDTNCHLFGDCCADINNTCPAAVIPPSEISLVVANSFHILQLTIDGSIALPLTQLNFEAFYISLDYDYRENVVYFSDLRSGGTVVGRTPLNGSVSTLPQNLTFIQYGAIEDLAVDWIANNLYWTDSYYNRLEAFDLDTLYRTELLRTGAHTAPRAIVIDPSTRYMYWTDWGEPAKIERASMDGNNREVLHNTGLTWPNGLAIDYELQRLYWADALHDRIEYSSVDGIGREILLTVMTGLHHPFAITISGDQVYWTDWANFTVYTAHKQSPISILPVYNLFFSPPSGIEAVDPSRQQGDIVNYCEESPCSHLCLLSASSSTNYTCACPEGSSLLSDGMTCSQITNITVAPPLSGSCAAAGYTDCCNGGYCAGSPPNCFCEPDCEFFGDCCDDFFSICMNPVTTVPTTQHTSPPQTSPSVPPTSHPTSQPTTPPQTSPSVPPTSHSTSQPTTQTVPPTTQQRTTPPETTQTVPPTSHSTSQPTTPPETTQTIPPTTMQQPTTPQTTESTTTQPDELPGPVTDLSAISPGDSDNTLIISWGPPEPETSGPLEISSYDVRVTNFSLAPVASIDVSGDITSTSVTGLGPFIPYIVSVTAVVAIGEGDTTAVINFTREGAPPVSPSNVKAEKIDSGTKIKVSWEPLTPEEAQGFVTSYTIAYTKEGELRKRQMSEKIVPGTQNSTIIEGLDPNQDYSVSVKASTKAGVGKISEPTSTKVSVSTNVSRASGGAIAGGLIAVIVALVVVALLVLVTVWLTRRRARKNASNYTMFDDSMSLSSSTSEDFRPRMNSYQQTGIFKKKKKKEELAFNGDGGNVDTESYSPVDVLPSFDNPVYATSPASEPIVLPGATDGSDDPVYEDVKDVKLDQYEVPKLKTENPYVFTD